MNKLDSIEGKLKDTLSKAVDSENMSEMKKIASERLKNFNKIYSDEDAKTYITNFIKEVIPRDMRIDLNKQEDISLTDSAVSIYFFQRGHGRSVILAGIIVICFICTNFMNFTKTWCSNVIVGQPNKYNTDDLLRDIKKYSEPMTTLSLVWTILSSIFVLGQSIVKTLLSVLLVQPLLLNSWFSGFSLVNKIINFVTSLFSGGSGPNILDKVSSVANGSGKGASTSIKIMNTLLGEKPEGFLKNNSNIKKYMDKYLGISIWMGIYIPLFFFVIKLGKILYKIVKTDVDYDSIKTGTNSDPNKKQYNMDTYNMFECWYNNTGAYSMRLSEGDIYGLKHY